MAPAYSKPFPGEYDHIILFQGNHYEMICRICEGNCKPRTPFAYFKKSSHIKSHATALHNGEKGDKAPHAHADQSVNTLANIEEEVYCRPLTAGDVSEIAQGRGDEVIKKMCVTSCAPKVEGKAGKFVKAQLLVRPEVTLKNYPTIVQKADGTYVQLRCPECGSNARYTKGSNRPKDKKQKFRKNGLPYKARAQHPRPLEIISGVRGMSGHISNLHMSFGKVPYSSVIYLCGLPLTTQQLQQVQSDRTGAAIEKKLGAEAKRGDRTEIKRHKRLLIELGKAEQIMEAERLEKAKQLEEAGEDEVEKDEVAGGSEGGSEGGNGEGNIEGGDEGEGADGSGEEMGEDGEGGSEDAVDGESEDDDEGDSEDGGESEDGDEREGEGEGEGAGQGEGDDGSLKRWPSWYGFDDEYRGEDESADGSVSGEMVDSEGDGESAAHGEGERDGGDDENTDDSEGGRQGGDEEEGDDGRESDEGEGEEELGDDDGEGGGEEDGDAEEEEDKSPPLTPPKYRMKFHGLGGD
ncbi:hypothetical protein LTR09_012912 [Extremus antarcticus]|uniref:Uncharacterized protein n=1 Tax=Extremus antarcticus TaxID=702011 RepID=A0AAJ0G6P4_9PEZI|nr:hypothetical protein LTR09_012912 [Extremus antarcticus]